MQNRTRWREPSGERFSILEVQRENGMKSSYAGAVLAVLICLTAGLAFADDGDDDTFALPIDKPEQNYGNLVAPGVPDNIGPDDHNNTHRGENGWHAPDGLESRVPEPKLPRLIFVLWIF